MMESDDETAHRRAGLQRLTIHHIAELMSPQRVRSRVSRERALTQPRRSHTETQRATEFTEKAAVRWRPLPRLSWLQRSCARSARPPITRERSG